MTCRDSHLASPIPFGNVVMPRDNCRIRQVVPFLSLATVAVLVWAAWQKIKPRRGYIWWTCANDPWGKRR
jgi:hypothetical protein